MQANHKRLLVWSLFGLTVAVGIALAFRPQPVAVDLVSAQLGDFLVTVDEEGATRVHDVFTLSAPVVGNVRRIEVHVGDPVVANETVLASIEPGDPSFLDPRTEAQAQAAIEAAQSASDLAAAEVQQAEAELTFARTDYRRATRLIAAGTITQRELDAAERAFKSTRAALNTAQASLQMRNFELKRARAELVSPVDTTQNPKDCACIDLTAPVDGRVLKIFNPSQRLVSAAEPLLEIGNPQDLEIVVDYLSVDAVRIEAGQRVIVDNWGGTAPLHGMVRRVEPFGYTKVSALGIEEQRVNVIVDFTGELIEWARLGHGFQVETRVVLVERESVLTVPLTAVFRSGEHWAVFVLDGNRASLRTLQLGERNGLVAEVLAGIEAGTEVVMHPSDRLADGVLITPRG